MKKEFLRRNHNTLTFLHGHGYDRLRLAEKRILHGSPDDHTQTQAPAAYLMVQPGRLALVEPLRHPEMEINKTFKVRKSFKQSSKVNQHKFVN